MPVELRRAKPPDADFVLELLADDDVRQFLGPRTAAAREEVVEEIERSLSEPESFGRFLIQVDGEPAGMLGFHIVNERSRIARLRTGRIAVGGVAGHVRKVGNATVRVARRWQDPAASPVQGGAEGQADIEHSLSWALLDREGGRAVCRRLDD